MKQDQISMIKEQMKRDWMSLMGFSPENDIDVLRFEHIVRQENRGYDNRIPVFEYISTMDVMRFYCDIKQSGQQDQWDDSYARFKKTFGTVGKDMEVWTHCKDGEGNPVKLKSKEFIENMEKNNYSV